MIHIPISQLFQGDFHGCVCWLEKTLHYGGCHSHIVPVRHMPRTSTSIGAMRCFKVLAVTWSDGRTIMDSGVFNFLGLKWTLFQSAMTGRISYSVSRILDRERKEDGVKHIIGLP